MKKNLLALISVIALGTPNPLLCKASAQFAQERKELAATKKDIATQKKSSSSLLNKIKKKWKVRKLVSKVQQFINERIKKDQGEVLHMGNWFRSVPTSWLSLASWSIDKPKLKELHKEIIDLMNKRYDIFDELKVSYLEKIANLDKDELSKVTPLLAEYTNKVMALFANKQPEIDQKQKDFYSITKKYERLK